MVKKEFIHIPKSGGVSIRNYGKEHDFQWGLYSEPLQQIVQKSACKEHTPPRRDKKLEQYYLDNDTFCVKRDPYDHLISSYYYNRKHRYRKPDTSCGEHRQDMNESIQKEINNYNKDVITDWHCMNVPQTEYIYTTQDGKPVCKNIFEFDEISTKIPSFLGIDDPMDKENKTTIDKKCTRRDLDKKTVTMINDTYKKDFNDLGYTKL